MLPATAPKGRQFRVRSISASPRGHHRSVARLLGGRAIRSHVRSATPRFLALILVAASFATGALASSPPVARAAGIKVVVIVGPVASETAHYIRVARDLASQARTYGASVYEIYTPDATWSRVVQTSQGANLLIYLGHGNGFPSPYGPFQPDRMDGLGLNAVAGAGNANQQYFGEARIEQSIHLAPNAVVLLNHLCYASGNAEWGRPDPSLSVAISAGRQLRRRVPSGRCGRGHRRRPLDAGLRPRRAVQVERDAPGHLLVVGLRDELIHGPFHLEADARSPGDHGSVPADWVLPLDHRPSQRDGGAVALMAASA